MGSEHGGSKWRAHLRSADKAVDIVRRYQRFNEQERQEMISAFDYAKSWLEMKHGEIHTWGLKHKASIVKVLSKAAKEGYLQAPHGSCGVALVGLYLEAQTLSGEKAKRLVHLIEEWRRRAVTGLRMN
jgi:hypothetical protein